MDKDQKESSSNNLPRTGGYARKPDDILSVDSFTKAHETAVDATLGQAPHYARKFEDAHIKAIEATFGNMKPTNPKDAVGIKKPPMSCVPLPVIMEVGVAMLEGARKYGRHNYRDASVRASVYFDAAMRHLFQWYEGEDEDPDSSLNHITKAISSLVVLRDGMIQDKWVDDRPPKTKQGWLRDMNGTVDMIFEKYPEAKEAFTEMK